MRIRAAAAAALASVSVLTVGWLVGAPAAASLLSAVRGGTATTSSPTTATAANSASDAATAPHAATPAGAAGTFEGSVVQTRFGPMQVSVTVDNGSITDVTALQLTNDDRKSVMISNRAAPILRDEVLTAQSADVANVSGATYTSDGYLTSLQAALDAARF